MHHPVKEKGTGQARLVSSLTWRTAWLAPSLTLGPWKTDVVYHHNGEALEGKFVERRLHGEPPLPFLSSFLRFVFERPSACTATRPADAKRGCALWFSLTRWFRFLVLSPPLSAGVLFLVCL